MTLKHSSLKYHNCVTELSCHGIRKLSYISSAHIYIYIYMMYLYMRVCVCVCVCVCVLAPTFHTGCSYVCVYVCVRVCVVLNP